MCKLFCKFFFVFCFFASNLQGFTTTTLKTKSDLARYFYSLQLKDFSYEESDEDILAGKIPQSYSKFLDLKRDLERDLASNERRFEYLLDYLRYGSLFIAAITIGFNTVDFQRSNFIAPYAIIGHSAITANFANSMKNLWEDNKSIDEYVTRFMNECEPLDMIAKIKGGKDGPEYILFQDGNNIPTTSKQDKESEKK